MKDVRVQWQTLFLITTAFYVFSTMFYVLCGSGKLQWWALGDAARQVPVRQADGLTPTADVGSRPQSAVMRHFSSPSTVYPTKPDNAEPYCSDTLRRAAEAARGAAAAAAAAPNHISGDDSDAMDDRKPSSKSTSSSKTRDDVTSAPPAAARRTDHDRDHPARMRRDQSMSAKQRHSKPSQTKPSTTTPTTTTTPPALPTSPDEGLRIYESLSESPV